MTRLSIDIEFDYWAAGLCVPASATQDYLNAAEQLGIELFLGGDALLAHEWQTSDQAKRYSAYRKLYDLVGVGGTSPQHVLQITGDMSGMSEDAQWDLVLEALSALELRTEDSDVMFVLKYA
jgi:hypothetical protein